MEGANKKTTEEKQSRNLRPLKITLTVFLRITMFVVIIAVGLCFGLLSGVVVGCVITTEPVEIEEIYSSQNETVIYDSNDNVICTINSTSGTTTNYVSINQIPEYLQHAFVAIEVGRLVSGKTQLEIILTPLCCIIAGAAAVGIFHPKPEVVENLIQANGIDDEVHGIEGPFFYLQGGIDPKKLGWMKRKILALIANNMMKSATEDNSDWDVADALKMGGTFVKKENLQPIVAWFKN